MRNADAPNGISLEAVGAPGEQLADAVQAPAARGQMQRRAPGESAGGTGVNVAPKLFFLFAFLKRCDFLEGYKCAVIELTWGKNFLPECAAGGGHDGAVLEQDVDAAAPALPGREVQRRRPGVVPHVDEARVSPAPPQPQLRPH